MRTPTRSYSRRQAIQLLGLGAGVLGVGGLAACAPSAQPAGGGGDGVTGGSETQDFGFAAWSLAEEAPRPVIEGLVGDFESQSGASINAVSYPFNEYLNQLTLQVRGGEFAGAAQLDVAWLGALAQLGQLQDLSGYVDGRGYADAALGAGQYEGQQLGLPWTIGAIGLVRNTELWDQAGISEVPTTTEDFEAALTELKGIGGGVIPYAASTKVAQLKDILIWMETFGSPLVENGRTTFGDDATVEAVTWYKRLYDNGLIAPDVDRFDARALFSQGQAALYDDAIVGKSAVLADSPDPDLEAKLDPVARPVLAAGDDPRALFWGHLVVVAGAEGAQTASEFAQWLTSDEEVVVGYFEDLGLPPTTEEALASDVVTGDDFTAAFGDRVTATATTNPLWQFPNYAQMESAVAEQVQAVLVGSSTPAEAMRAAGETVNALI